MAESLMNTVRSVELRSTYHGSDKLYNIHVVRVGGGYLVNFQYGRRGSRLTAGCKTRTPVTWSSANQLCDRLKHEKVHGASQYQVLSDQAFDAAPAAEPTQASPPDWAVVLGALKDARAADGRDGDDLQVFW